MQVFPTERQLEHLVGAVMCEQDEQWSASQYFAYDKMRELHDERRKKEPEAPGRSAADLAEAARKMILASLEFAEKVGYGVAWPLGFQVREKAEAPSPFRFAVLARAVFAVPSENGLRQHSRHYLPYINANALLIRPRNRRFGFPRYSVYFSQLAILANHKRRSFCLLFAACLA